MKKLFKIATVLSFLSLVVTSCGSSQSDKEKELELNERELELREREQALEEKEDVKEESNQQYNQEEDEGGEASTESKPKVTPSKSLANKTNAMRIDKIEVHKLPRTNSKGYMWDSRMNGNYPDVVYKFYEKHHSGRNVILSNGNSKYPKKNIRYYPISFHFTEMIKFNNDPIMLYFFDDDFDKLEDMAGVYFNPKDYIGKSRIDLTTNELSVTLYLKWFHVGK